MYRSTEVSHLSSKLLFFLLILFQLPVLLSEKNKVAQLCKVGVLLAVAVTFSLSTTGLTSKEAGDCPHGRVLITTSVSHLILTVTLTPD